MQAITTRYAGPTATQGARINASAGDAPKRVTAAWDYALDAGDNHRNAARVLADALGWTADGYALATGSIDAGHYVHVLVLA